LPIIILIQIHYTICVVFRHHKYLFYVIFSILMHKYSVHRYNVCAIFYLNSIILRIIMSTSDSLIGRQLGDYKIEGLIGHGGMARVYRGYDEKLDRYAAIKVIEPTLITSDEDGEYRDRFLREARSIARLNHPNIVGVYQFAQEDNLYFIAMAFLDGRDMREVLKENAEERKIMPRDQMLKILHDIASSLDYAHKNDIIHRDIKPSNIIITTEGNAVLTDFGLALNAVEGTIGNTFGSVHYIAPEQAISSAQSVPQSDQYSLGVIVYELFAGQVPFDDASAMSVALKHISDPPPPIRDLNSKVSPVLEAVVMRALDKEPNNRYDTVKEFINDLEKALDDSPDAFVGESIANRSVHRPPASPSMDDDAPTIADSKDRPPSISSAIPTAVQPSAGKGGGGMNMTIVAIAAIIVIGLIVGGLLMANSAAATAAATETAVANAIIVAENETATEDSNIANTVTAEFEAEQLANANGTATAEFEAEQLANANGTATAEFEAEQLANANGTATAEFEAEQLANSNGTATAEFEAEQTANANATATAEFEAEQLANANGTATAEFEAEQLANANGTATAEFEAEQLANANGTATAEFEAEQLANANGTATAEFEATSVAQHNATVTQSFAQTQAALPTLTPSATHTPSPTATLTPTLSPTPTATTIPLLALEGEQQLLLRYDGRSILMTNRMPDTRLFINTLVFTKFVEDEDGNIAEADTFRMSDFTGAPSPLNHQRCLQLWDGSEFSQPSSNNRLMSDSCNTAPFWRTSSAIFWADDSRDFYFEVSVNGIDLLATCPTNLIGSLQEQRCVIQIN
jgi:serine/threonine protein kinase